MREAYQRDTRDAVTELLVVLEGLKPNPADLIESEVHRIRLAIKRARAWLKLCRAATGRTASYQQSVASLRALSQALSGQRDRDVALLTLDSLIRKSPGKKAQRCVNVLIQWIASRPLPAPVEDQLDKLIGRLAQQLKPFLRLEIPDETQLGLIKHAYARMCKAGDVALQSKACEDLHAWRKRVKTLGYQLEMIDCHVANRKKTHLRLGKLGQRLGEVHDLCVLQDIVVGAMQQIHDAPDPTPVLKRIDRERRRLVESAQKHHARICSPVALRLTEM